MTAATRARLTEGPVGRHLVRLTVPMIWGLLAMMTFNVADTYFVGQLGVRELAAMSFTFPVVFAFISIAIGLGAGTSSVLARAIGEGDHARVRRLTTDSLGLGFVTVTVISAAGIATIDPLFTALGAGPGLLPLVRDYMVIWYLGVVFFVVPMIGMSAIRATGDARLPGLVLGGSALFNIALDPLLIFGLWGFPRLELEGAAIATVVARALTFVIALWVLHRRLHMLTFEWPGMAGIARSWRAILHVGLPAAGTNVIIPLASGVIVALIARFGADAVAGYGVALRIEAMTLVVFFALSAIIGPFAGQNLGAGKRERIFEALRLSVVFCFAFGALAAVALWLAGRPLAALFNDSPQVVAAASAYLWIVPLSYGGAGVLMTVNAAFNGLGLPGHAVVISLLRMLGVHLPAAFLGAWLFGLEGIFGAAALANLSVGIGAYLWFRRACARQARNRAALNLPETEPV